MILMWYHGKYNYFVIEMPCHFPVSYSPSCEEGERLMLTKKLFLSGTDLLF